MLVHRLRRRSNIKPTPGQRLVSAGKWFIFLTARVLIRCVNETLQYQIDIWLQYKSMFFIIGNTQVRFSNEPNLV